MSAEEHKDSDDILKLARQAIELRVNQQGTFTMPMSQDAIAVYALLKIEQRLGSIEGILGSIDGSLEAIMGNSNDEWNRRNNT